MTTEQKNQLRQALDWLRFLLLLLAIGGVFMKIGQYTERFDSVLATQQRQNRRLNNHGERIKTVEDKLGLPGKEFIED